MKSKFSTVLGAIFILAPILAGSVTAQPAKAQLSTVRNIIFPVIGKVNYSDDFGNARTGHTHEGNDLLGKKMMPLVAAVDGTVSFVVWPEASYGYMVSIRDSDGYKYNYLHINNDNIGTDDHLGSGALAYAPGIEEGAKVVRGQLIGYMGDSGNAETTSPHLHFEIRLPDDTAFSPYQSLKQATVITAPVPAPQQNNELLPYGEFTGGASVAVANIDSDSTKEIITGAGPGGGPHVRRFESIPTTPAKSTSIPGDFFAYDTSFTGGVDVAAADTTGDGKAEIITAPGPGGGPHIKVFKADGTLLNQFFAYAGDFHGGVNVAAGDIDGDGKAEIITSPKGNGGAHIKIFKADGTLIKEFFAYDGSFLGGADVAVVPKEGSKPAVIITGAGPGGGPHIKTFNSAGKELNNWFAYDQNFHGGLRVSAGKIGTSSTSAYQVATAPATGGGPDFKLFSLTGTSAKSYTAFEKWWSGAYDIAVGATAPIIASGPGGRRATVRQLGTSSSGTGTCTSRRCRNQNSNSNSNTNN
jgi:hypothetical protein